MQAGIEQAGKDALRASAATAAAAALSACGAGGGTTSTGSTLTETPGRNINLATLPGTYTQTTLDSNPQVASTQAARFLQQAQFSSRPEEIAAVRNQGYTRWLEVQMATPYTSAWDWLNLKGYNDVYSSSNYYDSTTPGDYMVWNQLMTAPDAARKRMALALSEIFVVSLNGLDFNWRSHAAAHYWDTLCTHAFGNYRSLLGAITLNVAMGYYLNTKGNKKADGRGSQPDENYAREVMQLFTIGLVELNANGTSRLLSGNPIDTYGASDVSNLAKVFTGYDLDQSQNANTVIAQAGGGTRTIPNTAFTRLPLKVNNTYHATEAATFLGFTIPANTPADVALNMALDHLFNHANTAPFICKQLIQRLVTSNPSAGYVQRVASVFANNGAGVRGDLGYVFAAILLDDEARGSAGLSAPEFGKLREPMVRLVQWGRTFGAASATGRWRISDQTDAAFKLGQSPLRSPSVFNFFRPGYVPPATLLAAGSVAPEFQLVNESSVAGYLNTMMAVISNGMDGGDIKATYTNELSLALQPADLLAHLNQVLCAGQLSATNLNLILNALVAMPSATDANLRNRVYAGVLMVMASTEYLVQK